MLEFYRLLKFIPNEEGNIPEQKKPAVFHYNIHPVLI